MDVNFIPYFKNSLPHTMLQCYKAGNNLKKKGKMQLRNRKTHLMVYFLKF